MKLKENLCVKKKIICFSLKLLYHLTNAVKRLFQLLKNMKHGQKYRDEYFNFLIFIIQTLNNDVRSAKKAI